MEKELEQLRQKMGELEKALNESEKCRRESEERFFRLFHASPNLMAIAAIKDGRMIDLNEASAAFGGYRREELIGAIAAERRLWADPKQRDMVIRKVQEEGSVHNLEVELLTRSGDRRTVLFSADPIMMNEEPCILSVSVDITDREIEADALRESNEKYRILVENSLQGLSIVQDEHFVFCNHALAAMTGYSVEELLSFPDSKALLHPEDLAAVYGRHQDRLAGRSVSTTHHEHRIFKKDGSVCWMEVQACLIEYNGKPAIQVVSMDITERKQAQAEHDRLVAAVEQSSESIVIIDANKRVQYVNPIFKATTGKEREEVIGHHLPLNEYQDEAFYRKFWATLESGKPWQGRLINTKKNGTLYTEDVTISPVFNADGAIVNYVSISKDITEFLKLQDEKEKLQAQFLQAQKMEAIGILAGGIAHDFNNLLNVINGYCELVLEEFAPDDPKRNEIEQIGLAGKRAAILTSQLLAFSRKQILRPEILDLNRIITSMSSMLRRLIKENIELVTIAQPDLGFINVDPGQIHQIIMNLVVNARDAMPEGGKLTIETADVNLDVEYVRDHPVVKPGPHVMLAISDNGIGMDDATKTHLFEPFFTTKEKGQGTGLGLSTVYGIVKQSNGSIWFYSELGKGTTFKVYFPRAEGDAPPLEEEAKSERGARGIETVLLAEDDSSLRALAVRILRERGYTVLEASNGNDALDIAREYAGEINLLITDVVMPGMGGKILESQIRATHPRIKTLYVSGYTDNAIVHHGILDPNVSFLQKPFTVESLVRKVRRVIDS